MHPVTWRLAEQEVLRFLRRRETFWTLAGVGGFFLLCPVFLLLSWSQGGEPTVKFSVFGNPAGIDSFLTFGMSIEAIFLWFIAIHLGLRTVRQELETGSWILLAQTPNPASRLWAGKLIGACVSLLLVHCFLSLPALSFTPLIRRTHFEVALLFLGVYFYTACAVPEGMVYGLVGKRWPKLVYVLYAFTVIRLGLPLPFLVSAVQPDLLGRKWGIVELATELRFSSRSMSEMYAHWWVVPSIILLIQLLTALPYWLALARTRR